MKFVNPPSYEAAPRNVVQGRESSHLRSGSVAGCSRTLVASGSAELRAGGTATSGTTSITSVQMSGSVMPHQGMWHDVSKAEICSARIAHAIAGSYSFGLGAAAATALVNYMRVPRLHSWAHCAHSPGPLCC